MKQANEKENNRGVNKVGYTTVLPGVDLRRLKSSVMIILAAEAKIQSIYQIKVFKIGDTIGTKYEN